MKVLLIGSGGQLGQAFTQLSKTQNWPLGWTLTPWDLQQIDLGKTEAIFDQITAFRPQIVINAAAYTQVDAAEKNRDACAAINAKAPAELARACEALGAVLVHYSTDYVYSGLGSEPRNEGEPIAPINFYGETKAQGDAAILKSHVKHLIFRTSWVYAPIGKNFVLTMLDLAQKEELKVVDDQIGSPTYAPDLAEYSLAALMAALEGETAGKKFPSGVYHLCNSGVVSWCDFARAILPGKTILGIPSHAYVTPAARPKNSRLSLEKFITTFGITPRPWQAALAECLQEIKKWSTA